MENLFVCQFDFDKLSSDFRMRNCLTQINKFLMVVCIFIAGFACFILFFPVMSQRLDNSKMQSLRIYDCHGTLLREVLSDTKGRGIWVPLQDIAPTVLKTTIAVEDKRFYHHFGIDLIAIARALWLNLRYRHIVSGGSTITQQLARLMYHLPHRWYAKPLEGLLALRLELYLSKLQILEQYLNRIPFGNQIYGIEAASRTYFNKPCRHLSWFEAAYLIGLPQSPTRYNPYLFPDRAKQRQSQVLQLLYRKGFIDSSQYKIALDAELKIVPYRQKFSAPHFCQMVLNKSSILAPPNRITTTVDGQLQLRIEELVASHVDKLSKNNVSNAAVLVIENQTNTIKVWIGSRNFYDETHQGQVDGVRALRQPGSTIKTFTYGLALENGFTAASILPDIETHAATTGGDFTVHNYDEKFHGPVRLRTALACSYNVATIRLLESIGADLLLEKLRLAGLSTINKPANFYGLGLTLGNAEVTLYDLTNAYAALARGGELLSLKYVLGEPEVIKSMTGTRLFPQSITFLLTDILNDPQARAPAFGLGGPLRLPFPCAAKTGTTKDFRDNWTIGYTSNYTVGVWVGNFDGQPMEKISGITGAAPLFRDIMLTLHEKAAPLALKTPPDLQRIVICPASGFLKGPDCIGSMEEYFLTGTEPHEYCAIHKRLKIDIRNGLLATETTPKVFIQSRIFECWSSEYLGWIEDAGLPRPPHMLSSLNSTFQQNLTISSPDNGDVFKIDPVLRREYQTLMFEAIVPDGMSKINWVMDDSIVACVGPPYRMKWMLQPGRHTLEATGEKNGQVLNSTKVCIQVL